jgi:hypothetical protein
VVCVWNVSKLNVHSPFEISFSANSWDTAAFCRILPTQEGQIWVRLESWQIIEYCRILLHLQFSLGTEILDLYFVRSSYGQRPKRKLKLWRIYGKQRLNWKFLSSYSRDFIFFNYSIYLIKCFQHDWRPTSLINNRFDRIPVIPSIVRKRFSFHRSWTRNYKLWYKFAMFLT